MKKIKFLAMMLVALATCVGFTSCGDDDEEEAANAIVGTWVGTMDGSDGYYDDEICTMTFTKDGQMTASGVSASEPEYNWYFTGTYKTQAYETAGNTVLTISIGGYFAGDDEYYDDDIDYEPCYINGDVLLISFDGSDYRLIKQK